MNEKNKPPTSLQSFITLLIRTVDELRNDLYELRNRLMESDNKIEMLQGQISDYCGEICEKRPMQVGCESCPFYEENND